LLLFESEHLSDGGMVAPNSVDILQTYRWTLGGWVKYLPPTPQPFFLGGAAAAVGEVSPMVAAGS
jgi:hypothetical protein